MTRFIISRTPDGFTWDAYHWSAYGETHRTADFIAEYIDGRPYAYNETTSTFRHLWDTVEDAIQSAVDTLYPLYVHGGYTCYCLTADGDTLHSACARKETREALQDAWESRDVDASIATLADAPTFVIDEEAGRYGDVTCAACNEEISAHYCVDCGDPLHRDGDTLPVLYRESGDLAMHGHCLARQIVDGNGHKDGKGIYTLFIPSSQSGTYTAS
jgi:hypothetical protein